MRLLHPMRHAHRHDPDAFQGAAKHYDHLSRLLLTRPYRRIARDAATALGQGASVLDIGTGPGRLLLELGRLRPDLRLTGVDVASDMVDTAAANVAQLGARATAVVGDAAKLPFEDHTFDLVISSLSLHHWADAAAGGAEVVRVLRPGGQLRIYDIRSAPFADLATGAGHPGRPPLERFPITVLPRPALRRLVLAHD